MIKTPNTVADSVSAPEGASSATLHRHRLMWRTSSPFSLGSSGAIPGIVVLVAFYVVYMIIDHQPRTLAGFSTILAEAATVGLAGVGEAIVVLSGGYDLSAGAVVGMVNVILATQKGFASDTIVMVLIGLAVGVGIGILNGIAVAILRVPPIIATLGALFIWEGVALLVLSQPGGTVGGGFVNALSGSLGSIPIPLILFVIAAALWRITKYTPSGRHIYMLGGDADSTRANGINVTRALLLTYGAAGFFYGFAGLFYTASTASGDPQAGSSLLLPIIASVVLGGILFGGGKGDPAAAIVGAMILTLISDVLYAFGVSSFYTGVFDGGALIVALTFSMLSGRVLLRRRMTGAPVGTAADRRGAAV